MKSRFETLILTVLLTGLATACPQDSPSNTTPRSEGAPQKAGAAEKHAPAGVERGSHEDWCGEHAVPESMCTQCDPSLVAAFKATGDWCPEHGIPESQCRICNPDLKIERPPKKAGAK